ncbi:exosortase E/protease, VPEID-CTERM system [uncultured Roseobacter sp.]|uniref:exosortase E/protease, VPEID-CTERM system n=1 Tax=uncultured Roseobacter sp. TaxID=114847 RepID=UPI0026362C19|nr:exosortase E/protease, VPEID-CTERM system [uncultured Roseobacter sp.]
MASTDVTTGTASPPRYALILAGALLVVELGVIGTIFKHSIRFTCLDNWPQWACAGASGMLVALYCVLGALVLFATLRPNSLRTLFQVAGARNWPLAVNVLGAAVCLVPVLFVKDGAGLYVMPLSFGFWFLGMVLLLSGLSLYLAPLPRWSRFIREEGGTLAPIVIAGACLPSFATLIRPLWQLDTIAGTTFTLVSWSVEWLGYDLYTDVTRKVIGQDPFYIDVAPQCSGIEGIVLVSLFITIYLALFRKDLRFPRALLLYPVGILTSAFFNVLRIAILLIIGLEGNPELAVGGFHSHAGWLMFTLVALGIVALAKTIPWLQRVPVTGPQTGPKAVRPPLPFLQDPVVAQILPFAIFMLSALPAQAFSQSPGVVYPLRVVAMIAAVALFWQLYLRLPWRVDPAALWVGAAVGAMWIAIPVDSTDATPPYGALTGGMLVAWFVLRGAGTVLLVPLIEELFFRGYLETRLRHGEGLIWKLGAALVTAGLFAALHSRWIEAFVASLLFSWAAHRNGGRLVDAILAHAVANAIVFGFAVATGNLAVI